MHDSTFKIGRKKGHSMLTVILVALTGLLLGVYLARRHHEQTGTSIWFGMIGIMFGTTVGLIIATVWGNSSPTKWEEVNRSELYGLSNGLSATGGGRVYVRISPTNAYTYWYPVKNDINGIPVEDSFRSETAWGNVQIIQEERQGGILVIYQKVCAKNAYDLWRFCSIESNNRQYSFYVPKGTVAGTYELK